MKRRSVTLRVAQLACLLCQVANASGAFTLPAASCFHLGGGQVPEVRQVEPPFHSVYQGPTSFRGPARGLEQALTDDGETGLFSPIGWNNGLPNDHQLIPDTGHNRAGDPASVVSAGAAVDMPPEMPPQAPASQSFDWNGWYAGGCLGFATGSSNWSGAPGGGAAPPPRPRPGRLPRSFQPDPFCRWDRELLRRIAGRLQQGVAVARPLGSGDRCHVPEHDLRNAVVLLATCRTGELQGRPAGVGKRTRPPGLRARSLVAVRHRRVRLGLRPADTEPARR